MRVTKTEQGWALEAIGDLEWLFLERLPGMASGEDLQPEQKRRLLPDPIAGADKESEGYREFIDDWNEFVRPDLHSAFSDARDLVAEDLKGVAEDRSEAVEDDDDEVFAEDEGDDGIEEPKRLLRLEVVGEHSDLWYSTLNQARLLMNEVYDLANAEQRLYEAMADADKKADDADADGEDDEPDLDGQLWLLLAQYQFYSFIQTFLLDRVMKP